MSMKNNEEENDIESVTPLTKPEAAFLRDMTSVGKLLKAHTDEHKVREEIKDTGDFMIYYDDGVLTVEDGKGNITRYVKSELYFRMETLKEELRQVIIKSDAPFELQERLINGITEIIDDYVEEKEENDETRK